MKKALWVVLISLVLAGTAAADVFKRVVLYQDTAYLTVERTTADRKLVIEAPPEMIPESLSVVPLQGGAIRSISVEPRRIMSGRAAQIKDELAKSEASLEGKKRLKATCERQIEVIFEAANSKGKETVFSKPRLTEALSFIDARVGSLNAKAISLDREIEELSLKVKDLQNELSQVSRKQGLEIVVETDSDRTVQVSYAVRNGSWQPEYTVRADPARGELVVETSAVLRQATGTDWEIGELSVATGRPGFGIEAPELTPWNIGLPRPYARDAGMVRQKSMMAAPSPMAEEAAEYIEPEVKATAVSYLIGAARGVTLPGDGKPKSVVLQRKKAAASMERFTAPKMDGSVFLRASTTWDGQAPLLAGQYTAFVEGEFMGRGSMKQAQPGEKITVDLGRDEGIKVERKDKVFHERTLTGKDRTTYTYTMTVKNTRTTPAKVTLKDQIPVSMDEKVKVELIDADPKAVPDKDGILTWELDLKPGAQALTVFSFSVTGMPPL
jgi:uncharacterized protein (TIGR02231 family)